MTVEGDDLDEDADDEEEYDENAELGNCLRVFFQHLKSWQR